MANRLAHSILCLALLLLVSACGGSGLAPADPGSENQILQNPTGGDPTGSAPTNPSSLSWYEGGTPTNSTYNSVAGGFILSPNFSTGSFNSRSLTYGSSIGWNSLTWQTPRPYLKELPANATSESGYTQGNISMLDNLLLLHLNDPAGTTTLVDSSGNDDVVVCTNCPTFGLPGRFKTSAQFDGKTSIINAGTGPDITGTGPFTLSAWIQTTSVGPEVIIQQRDPNHYLGEYQFGVGIGTNATPGALSFFSYQSDSNNQHVYSTTPVNDGNWHHVVVVRDSAGDLIIYQDGQVVGTDTAPGNTTSLIAANVYVGADGRGSNPPTPQYYFQGLIDEVAVFARAFQPSEVTDLYLRGALRLQFQVRACQTSGCSDAGFVGPDGTAQTYYSELNNSLPTPGAVALTGLNPALYFQYEAFLQSDISAESPVLGTVNVGIATGH